MMITITKQTILKEVLTVRLDSSQVIQLEVTQVWSIWQEAEVNPTYFYHLGLRCFPHLRYTSQNQCNKKSLSKKDFIFFSSSQTKGLLMTSIDFDAYWQMKDPVFSKACRQKVPAVQSLFLVCIFTTLLHVQWGPVSSAVHDHQFDMTIYMFRKSEPECTLSIWINRFSCSVV